MWYQVHDQSDGTWVARKLLEKGIVSEEEADRISNDILEAKTVTAHVRCAYCGRDALSVFDKFSSSRYWGYLGNQAMKPNVYTYSPIINALRLLDGCKGSVWTNNPLYNVHARVHSKPTRDYSVICSRNSLQLLCNECFRQTYRRVRVTKVSRQDGLELPWNNRGVKWIEISVLPERGETPESVIRDLGLEPRESDPFVLRW